MSNIRGLTCVKVTHPGAAYLVGILPDEGANRMTSLRARDLMTPDVVTVPPETPVIAIARLLADRGISAVPVVDADGKVLGIVTEAGSSPASSPTRSAPRSATRAPMA